MTVQSVRVFSEGEDLANQPFFTAHIPRDNGVYPVEVTAPRLFEGEPRFVVLGHPPRPRPIDECGGSDVPEPATMALLFMGLAFVTIGRLLRIRMRRTHCVGVNG